MKLCIVARDDNLEAAHLARVAEGWGHEVARVSFADMLVGVRASFDGHACIVGDVELSACDAFVLRQVPASPALLAPPDEVARAAEWYRLGKQHEERATFAWSVLVDLEQRGVPMVNPLGASGPFDHKPLQLAAFLRAGLPVPPTLISNDPQAVLAFCDRWRALRHELVVKPAAGGAAARLVDEELRRDLSRPMPSPAIFQRRARGRDVRVTVVGGEVVSSVVVENVDATDVDATTVDYRATDAWQRGAGVVAPYPLPPGVAAHSVRAAALCHHVLSGLDWKHDEASDTWELLEANSTPVTLGIEAQTGADISGAMLRWLEAAVAERSAP